MQKNGLFNLFFLLETFQILLFPGNYASPASPLIINTWQKSLNHYKCSLKKSICLQTGKVNWLVNEAK